MNTLEIKLYDLFRKELNLTEEKAREAVQTVESVVRTEFAEQFANNKAVFKSELKEDFEKIDARVQRVEERVQSLEIRIEKNSSNTIKWMFIFWITQFATILGIMFYFFNFILKK